CSQFGVLQQRDRHHLRWIGLVCRSSEQRAAIVVHQLLSTSWRLRAHIAGGGEQLVVGGMGIPCAWCGGCPLPLPVNQPIVLTRGQSPWSLFRHGAVLLLVSSSQALTLSGRELSAAVGVSPLGA